MKIDSVRKVDALNVHGTQSTHKSVCAVFTAQYEQIQMLFTFSRL